MTAALTEPTLAHSLLPSHLTLTELSPDAPSVGAVRPFGLTHTTEVPADALVNLTGLRYDPQRQVNIGPDAQPVSDPGQVIRMGTTTDTKYDNQWFTDKD